MHNRYASHIRPFLPRTGSARVCTLHSLCPVGICSRVLSPSRVSFATSSPLPPPLSLYLLFARISLTSDITSEPTRVLDRWNQRGRKGGGVLVIARRTSRQRHGDGVREQSWPRELTGCSCTPTRPVLAPSARQEEQRRE